MVIRFWPRSAQKRRIGDGISLRAAYGASYVASYDNVHVVPRAVADRLSPDSEPASGRQSWRWRLLRSGENATVEGHSCLNQSKRR